jgi:hypothetical protein
MGRRGRTPRYRFFRIMPLGLDAHMPEIVVRAGVELLL